MQKTNKSHDAEDKEESVKQQLHAAHHIPLSLMVVGTETALFDEKSKVRDRILSYTAPFREAQIIVLCGPGFTRTQAGDSVSVYPTNSRSRIGRFFDGVRIGRS